jgi:hypothetical protein
LKSVVLDVYEEQDNIEATGEKQTKIEGFKSLHLVATQILIDILH